MAKARYGTATAFGMFDAIYQLIAGLVLILYCTKLGGIPYGAALAISALVTGAFVVLARSKMWARKAVLFLGLAQLFLIFALGLVIDKVDGVKYIASNGVFALRTMAFYTGITLTISGVMFCNLDDEDNAGKLSLSTAVFKLISILGVFFSMIVPALELWQRTGKKAFNEWLLGFGGDNPDAALLLENFEKFTTTWGPIFAGIGALFLALVPTYLWFLDSQRMVVGEKSLVKTVVLDCISIPFFAFAEWTILSEFLKTKAIVHIVFMALIVVCYAALWVAFYILPEKLGWNKSFASDAEEQSEGALKESVGATVE